MAIHAGIDPGTSSSATVVDAPGRPLPGRTGGCTMPSMAYVRAYEAAGQRAKERQSAGESGVAAVVERRIGVPAGTRRAIGRGHTAVDLSAPLLHAPCACARHSPGEPGITVPSRSTRHRAACSRQAGSPPRRLSHMSCRLSRTRSSPKRWKAARRCGLIASYSRFLLRRVRR